MTPAERAHRIDEVLRRRRPSRPLLVGQAPSSATDGWPAFFGGRSGRRLAELSNLTWFDLVRKTERVNLLEFWPGKSRGKGDQFPAAAAREAVQSLLDRLAVEKRLDGRAIVAIGAGVLRAFRSLLPEVESAPYRWVISYWRGTTFQVAGIPHPSGIVTLWNDPANVAAASEFLREALP